VSWAYAYALRAGNGHERCDDVCICETLGDYIIAAVSDGAGSAEHAREGAAITCQTFLELAIPLFSGAIEPSCLVASVQKKIPSAQLESHSCTFVGAIAGPKGALILQIGDGACIVKQPSTTEFSVPIWPEETEFLNHTFFVTMADAEDHLRVHRLEEPIEQLALFTDGLQHLVLDLKTQQPHQPFFRSVFEKLASVPEQDIKASWWLERTLASDPVTKRTDDDTSIVIAKRLTTANPIPRYLNTPIPESPRC
jgi:hypothetical protein